MCQGKKEKLNEETMAYIKTTVFQLHPCAQSEKYLKSGRSA